MLNYSCFCGRLTRDPEFRMTQNNTPVATFCIAVQRDFNKDKTDFVNVVAWKHSAEYAKNYLQKGDLVITHGRMQCRSFTDKNGNNREVWELHTETLYSVGNKKPAPATTDDEPLPF